MYSRAAIVDGESLEVSQADQQAILARQTEQWDRAVKMADLIISQLKADYGADKVTPEDENYIRQACRKYAQSYWTALESDDTQAQIFLAQQILLRTIKIMRMTMDYRLEEAEFQGGEKTEEEEPSEEIGYGVDFDFDAAD